MRIHFLGSAKPAAQRAVQLLVARYGQSAIEEATHIVAIGGDGTALNALHAVRPTGRPVFAMRLPESVGALGNPFDPLGLPERLTSARKISIRPLKAEATRVAGGTATIFGINEIVVSRQRLQAAKLHVTMGETERCRKLIGDGLLVCTSIGSTGYNRSAGGPRLPQGSQLLAVTGLAVHHSSDWSNTVLNDQHIVDIEVVDHAYRQVRVETNMEDVPGISRVRISSCRHSALTLLLEGQ